MTKQIPFQTIVKVLFSALIWVLALAAILLAYLRSGDFADVQAQMARNTAVNECATSSMYQYTNAEKSVVIKEANKDTYKKCLLDKGFRATE